VTRRAGANPHEVRTTLVDYERAPTAREAQQRRRRISGKQPASLWEEREAVFAVCSRRLKRRGAGAALESNDRLSWGPSPMSTTVSLPPPEHAASSSAARAIFVRVTPSEVSAVSYGQKRNGARIVAGVTEP
jgi:hypothetical protein